MTQVHRSRLRTGLITLLIVAALFVIRPPAAAQSADPPTDGVLVVRDETWHLKTTLGSGPADRTFRYGWSSDTPFVGDWNGDGLATPGVFRGGTWHMNNRLGAGAADASFRFGRAGDTAIVGDWDGDGTDTIGVVRGNTWHLRNTNTSGAAHHSFRYGTSGDDPTTGDWDGDGIDTVGVVRDSTWHLRNTNTSGAAHHTFRYGTSGDDPVSGDWDGDGDETPGIVRGGWWHLRNELAGGSADRSFRYGIDGDLPLVLDETPPTAIEAGFNSRHALRAATELSEMGPRPAGTAGDRAARRWTTRQFEAARWRVSEQYVPLPQGGSTTNVIATLPGSTNDGPHVVIGAHLDTVAGSPGANDNASGIGVLIALAEELADEAGRLPVDVVLVAFGAEEYQPSDPPRHHVGSDRYAATYADGVVGMISVDMIANGDRLCICWLNLGPRTMADRLSATAHDLGIGTTYVDDVPDWSDHGPFARRGIPAAFLWTGRDANYHSPGDTAEHLRRGDIDRAGDLVLRFIRDLRPGDATGLDRP